MLRLNWASTIKIIWRKKLDICAGVFGPSYNLCLLLLFLEKDKEKKLFYCQTLMVLKSSITVLYFFTFFLSLVFRNVLIRFADRGLVVDGKPYLRLFRQIYWVAFSCFGVIPVLHFPILALLRGNFSQYIQERVEKKHKVNNCLQWRFSFLLK